MAIRAGLLRRMASTSLLSSESTVVAAASATPPPVPSTSLFVTGLNKRTTSESLKKAFSGFGEVLEGKVITDKVTGFSKGFGFVKYRTMKEAEQGIKSMDGQFLDGWVIFAEYARPKFSLRTTLPWEY